MRWESEKTLWLETRSEWVWVLFRYTELCVSRGVGEVTETIRDTVLHPYPGGHAGPDIPEGDKTQQPPTLGSPKGNLSRRGSAHPSLTRGPLGA